MPATAKTTFQLFSGHMPMPIHAQGVQVLHFSLVPESERRSQRFLFFIHIEVQEHDEYFRFSTIYAANQFKKNVGLLRRT